MSEAILIIESRDRYINNNKKTWIAQTYFFQICELDGARNPIREGRFKKFNNKNSFYP